MSANISLWEGVLVLKWELLRTGSLSFLVTEATCLLHLAALLVHRDLHKTQPWCCGMAYQDPGIFPFHHIVPHRMKLLVTDVLSWHDGPSVALMIPPIIYLKLCQSWFQVCLLGQAIFLAKLGEQAPEMTQWYTVCLRTRVNLNPSCTRARFV